LLEAFSELEEEVEEKFGDDEDSFENAVIEMLETSLEQAIDDTGISTAVTASMLSSLSEALEQLDPDAFSDEEAEFSYDLSANMVDYDDDNGDGMDLDDDENGIDD